MRIRECLRGLTRALEIGPVRTGANRPALLRSCIIDSMIRLAIAFLLCAVSVLAADISGTWSFEVVTDAGSGTPKFVFKQDGEKLSGTYSGQLGEAKVTGTVKGQDVTFSFDIGAAVVYQGKIDESGRKITGKCDIGGQATGTFTGTKQ